MSAEKLKWRAFSISPLENIEMAEDFWLSKAEMFEWPKVFALGFSCSGLRIVPTEGPESQILDVKERCVGMEPSRDRCTHDIRRFCSAGKFIAVERGELSHRPGNGRTFLCGSQVSRSRAFFKMREVLKL
jgi:hypothetical protein